MTFDALTPLADGYPDAVVIVTMDGIVLDWSLGAQASYGYTRDEALARSFDELVAPVDRGVEQRRMRLQTRTEGSIAYESVRRRKDGSLLYVDVTTKSLPAHGSEPARILCAEKDVTRIKVMRDAKLMDARFRDLLESTPDGIVMANPTGHIVIANSQAERLFGYETGELRGQSVDLLLPERFRHAHVGHRSNYFLQPRKRAMGSGLDLAGLRKDGAEFPIEISLSPLRTEESEFVMSAIRDISERKRFESALREKNAELASANQAKDRFLASMSHELRTPLNAIIGFTGTLLMKLPGPLTPDQAKQLGTVQASARHLLALINDLLDVAKIEAGKVELNPQPTDCRVILDEAANALRPLAEGNGLVLTVERPDEPVVLTIDTRALSQIILNLASNAIKFTKAGHVRLALSRQRLDTGNVTRLDVIDTGIGIPLEDQHRLFGAFSRVGNVRAGAPEGTGLGLHLSQKLATLLGGSISFVSEHGKGSTFTLTLPAA